MPLLISGVVMQSVEHTGLCYLQYEQWVGKQGQYIDLRHPFIQPEGGQLMSGKVEQTQLIIERLLEVAVDQIAVVMWWWHGYIGIIKVEQKWQLICLCEREVQKQCLALLMCPLYV